MAYCNELHTFAGTHGLNTRVIITGFGYDPRISSFYNNPAFGYGCYCRLKDTKQLLANYQDVPQTPIRAVVESNANRKDFIADDSVARKPKVVGIHWLAMKAGSYNFRESSILGVMSRLQARGVQVILHEPRIKEAVFHGAEVVRDLDECKRLADVIVANRLTPLADVAAKTYTRDLLGSG